MWGQLQRLIIGSPLRNDQYEGQRLTNPVALAVFSSDALSSVAYATEEILLMLALAGSLAFSYLMPIALAIGVLLVIVAISYRQTIKAYPSGGGAYIVAKENLGKWPGLVAGSALLVDYVLTVAVSVSAGTAAITSAFPALGSHRVGIAVTLVLFVAVANLRGMKESGSLFVGPTYLFVFMLSLLIVSGIVRYLTGGTISVATTHASVQAVQDLTLFLVLRAFASGCAAMTGIEAIANGVQAFKKPEAHNARKTLTWMAGMLLFLFLGTSFLAHIAGAQASEIGETVISQLAHGVFGDGVLYYLLQAATAAILVLAANTSYADFPRLASFMAADGFLAKQLRDRGTRLVYSNGMIVLTAVSIALLYLFGGDTHRLIPLYAVGVFTSFTLSQAGMVRHWWRNREPGWHWSIAVNGLGAATTFVVLIVIAVAKFALGAWIVLALIPVLVMYFAVTERYYAAVHKRLALPDDMAVRTEGIRPVHNHVVLLVSAIDKRLLRTLECLHTINAESRVAVFVDMTGDAAEEFRAHWVAADIPVPLTIIDSPYRKLVEPVRDYIRAIPRVTPHDIVTVLIPDFVPEEVADWVLHDQTSFFLRRALLGEPGVVVVDIPCILDDLEPVEDSKPHKHKLG